MKPLAADTSLAAEQVQLALLRQAGMARRVDLAAEMTRFAIAGTRAALVRRHPQASAAEIDLLFVEQHSGPALAARLRAALHAEAQ